MPSPVVVGRDGSSPGHGGVASLPDVAGAARVPLRGRSRRDAPGVFASLRERFEGRSRCGKKRC